MRRAANGVPDDVEVRLLWMAWERREMWAVKKGILYLRMVK